MAKKLSNVERGVDIDATFPPRDIRGSTDFTERLRPAQSNAMLQRVHRTCAEAVDDHLGVVAISGPTA